jgi:hypothetical protein
MWTHLQLEPCEQLREDIVTAVRALATNHNLDVAQLFLWFDFAEL